MPLRLLNFWLDVELKVISHFPSQFLKVLLYCILASSAAIEKLEAILVPDLLGVNCHPAFLVYPYPCFWKSENFWPMVFLNFAVACVEVGL